MAQRSEQRSFRGKRSNPYSNKVWRERHGGDKDKREEDKSAQESSSADINNDTDHNIVDNNQVTAPIDFNERGGVREKKFGNRGRLYVGNLPRGTTEDELKELFSPFGEMEQVYLDKEKNFGFVRLGYRYDAMKAVSVLNGEDYKGRDLRIRFAANNCAVKVHNVHPTVSNELLASAFSTFGEVEFATVMSDDRGKSLGHGVVYFAKKPQATAAIDRCRIGCFILTRSPIPVYCTELNSENEEGFPEKHLQKVENYRFERDSIPRMAQPGSTEFDFASRWKALYDAEQKVRDEVENQLQQQRKILEEETKQFHHHENALILRKQLMEHQREKTRLEERLRQHEDFLKGLGGGFLPPPPPPPGMPLPPPSMGMPPPMMPGGIPGQPQPLLPDRYGGDGTSDGDHRSTGLVTDTNNGGLITPNMQYLLQQSGAANPAHYTK